MATESEKVRTGYRMPNGGIIEGTISLPYHDGREKAWTVVGFGPDELRALSESLADLAYRVEAANNATMTPMPKSREGSE